MFKQFFLDKVLDYSVNESEFCDGYSDLWRWSLNFVFVFSPISLLCLAKHVIPN